jgi:hypothetical protein
VRFLLELLKHPTDGDEWFFVERLPKRRRVAEQEQQYFLLCYVPPTSNMVVRFFSMARVMLGYERNSLHPVTQVHILFIR